MRTWRSWYFSKCIESMGVGRNKSSFRFGQLFSVINDSQPTLVTVVAVSVSWSPMVTLNPMSDSIYTLVSVHSTLWFNLTSYIVKLTFFNFYREFPPPISSSIGKVSPLSEVYIILIELTASQLQIQTLFIMLIESTVLHWKESVFFFAVWHTNNKCEIYSFKKYYFFQMETDECYAFKKDSHIPAMRVYDVTLENNKVFFYGVCIYKTSAILTYNIKITKFNFPHGK